MQNYYNSARTVIIKSFPILLGKFETSLLVQPSCMLIQEEDPRRAGPDLCGRDGHRVLLRRGDRFRLADSPQDRQVNNLSKSLSLLRDVWVAIICIYSASQHS